MSVRLPSILPIQATLADEASLAEGLRRANAERAEWLALTGPGETLSPDAISIASPAFQSFDAVFGAVTLGEPPGLWKPSRLAFDESERLPHALLHWWVGDPRFLRAAMLERFLAGGPPGETALDRLFRLWTEARCIKLAAPLAHRTTSPEPLSLADRSAILARLAAEPVFMPVRYGEHMFRLPYTGRNAGIEREQTRGTFFEAAELEVLKARMGPGCRIVDVGANTGNHTVFFAGPMAAAHVLPFEPAPEAALALRRAVDVNRLANVDLSRLGIGICAAPGRMRVVASERGGLGAGRLEAAGGEDAIPVMRLDDVLTERPDLLKIDVEGMELDVLAGAEAVIRAARPVIFIEINNANTDVFMDWLNLAEYRIERIFSDKGHANYLIAPVD